MADFTIVHMIEPMEEGAAFREWPLRLELVPKFEVTDLDGLDNELQRLRERHQAFMYTIGQFAVVGARRPREAQRVYGSPELTQLHEALVDTVDQHGEIFAQSAIRDRFEPHIVKQGVRVLGPGSAFLLNAVYLVKGPGGQSQKVTKTITRKYPLGDETQA